MNVVERLIKIQAEVGPIAKNRTAGTGGGASYSFRGIDDIYQALHSLMVKHEVINFIEVLKYERSERDRFDKKTGQNVGVMIHVTLMVKYIFVAPDGSKIESISIGEGADTGDKATNKALSAAHKYALLQCFMIPTDEPKDSENEDPEVPPKQKSIPNMAPKAPKKESAMDLAIKNYRIPFGKFKGEFLTHVDKQTAVSYAKYLSDEAAKKNKTIEGQVKEYIDFAEYYGKSFS